VIDGAYGLVTLMPDLKINGLEPSLVMADDGGFVLKVKKYEIRWGGGHPATGFSLCEPDPERGPQPILPLARSRDLMVFLLGGDVQ